MLIDQNKLKGATVSAGEASDLRAAGKKTGAYKSTEADAVGRIKALAKNR